MSINRRTASVIPLRWALGFVVLWESCHFAFSAAEAQHLGQMGLPSWLGPVLGGAESLAALMFLIPKLDRIGGLLLLVTFAVAAAIHVLHGQFQIGSLLVYSVAVFTCRSRDSHLASGATSWLTIS